MLQRSWFWLHVGIASLTYFFVVVAFVIIIIQKGLPQNPATLPGSEYLCSEPCPPIDSRKEEMNRSLAWGFLGDVYEINGLFTLLLHLPPSLICKRTWYPDPVSQLFWGASLPSSPSAGSQIIVSSLPQPLISWIGACCVASRASLDSITLTVLSCILPGGQNCIFVLHRMI